MWWRCRNSLAKLLLVSSCAAAWVGPKCAPAAAREFIDNSQHERQFRADHREIGLNSIGHRDHRFETLQVDGRHFGFVGDAAVAGSAVELGDARRLPQLPNQSVLASAAADDKNFHSETFKGRGARR